MSRIEEFLNYKLDRENGSIETNKGYRSDLKIFYQYIKRQKQIQDINDEVLQSLKLKDLDNFIIYVKKERNNSAYGQNRKIATIKSFFKYLYKQEIVNKKLELIEKDLLIAIDDNANMFKSLTKFFKNP